MILGIDYLGLGHRLFPVEQVIKLTPKGYAIGCFDNTFGDVRKAITKIAASKKFPIIRVHIGWDDNHKIVSTELLKKRVPFYEKLAKKYKNIKIYISHSCEYRESNAQIVQERVDIIKKLAPSCIPVNAVLSGATTKGVLKEKHGSNRLSSDIVSTDGSSCLDIDSEKFLKENSNAKICFLWAPLFNLRENVKPPQKLIKPKDRKAIPDPKYIRGVIRLSKPKGEAPKPSFRFQIKPIAKTNRLWKPYAEDEQGVSDKRENRPVLIVESETNELKVITKDGKSIGRLVYGGTFGSGQHRYYSGLLGASNYYAIQFARKAKAQSGSEFVWFKDEKNKVIYGPVNAAFREGDFR